MRLGDNAMRETGRTLFQRTASAMGWWTASDRSAGDLTPLYDTTTTIGETAVAGGYSAGLVTAFRLPIRSPSAVAIGYADLGHGVPLAADHAFPVGACLRQFVAAAILLLVEQNRIRLADPVDRFASEDLNSTGGSVQDLLDGGDLGYERLARLVAQVTGETFSQFVTTHLLLAAGMARSRVGASNGVVPQSAIGYRLKAGLAHDFAQTAVAGGRDLYATAGDLLLWNRALFNGRLLTHAAVDLMTNGCGEGQPSPELGRSSIGIAVAGAWNVAKSWAAAPSGSAAKPRGSMPGCSIFRTRGSILPCSRIPNRARRRSWSRCCAPCCAPKRRFEMP
jgi:CubicO group peptidase (beta-lactamase class C family)